MKRPEIRERIRQSKLGNKNPMWKIPSHKHPQWKGGVTALSMKIRTSTEYAAWRQQVYERDQFTCQLCGDARGGNLEAHHAKPLSYILEQHNILNWQMALACTALWDIENGITLCSKCHYEIQEVIKCLI